MNIHIPKLIKFSVLAALCILVSPHATVAQQSGEKTGGRKIKHAEAAKKTEPVTLQTKAKQAQSKIQACRADAEQLIKAAQTNEEAMARKVLLKNGFTAKDLENVKISLQYEKGRELKSPITISALHPQLGGGLVIAIAIKGALLAPPAIMKSCSGASVRLSYVDSGTESSGSKWVKYKVSINLTKDESQTPGVLNLEVVDAGGDGVVITTFQKLAGMTTFGNGGAIYDDSNFTFRGKSFESLLPCPPPPVVSSQWTELAIIKYERWGAITGPIKAKLGFGHQVHSNQNWPKPLCLDFSQPFFLP